MTNQTQNVELAKVKAKIRALISKYTDNGASEAEAMAAMNKVGELLDTFNLSMGDVSEIREEACITGDYETNSKHAGIVNNVAIAISAFTNTKVWQVRETTGIVIKFFGIETDVELACYIADVISNCFDGEYDKFKTTDTYVNYAGHRRVLKTDFQRGFASRVNARLHEIAAQNNSVFNNNNVKTGNSLVVVEKNKYVEEEFNKLDMRLTKSYSYKRRVRNGGAYSAGSSAGNKVNFNRPVNNNTNGTKLIGGY